MITTVWVHTRALLMLRPAYGDSHENSRHVHRELGLRLRQERGRLRQTQKITSMQTRRECEQRGAGVDGTIPPLLSLLLSRFVNFVKGRK
ncbi:hypothetical protein V8C44DRAFT_339045 [Trichoderma aethiopicum]